MAWGIGASLGLGDFFSNDSLVQIGVVYFKVVMGDAILKLEIPVAKHSQSVCRIRELNASSLGQPFVQFDLHDLVIGQVDVFDPIAHVNTQLQRVPVVDARVILVINVSVDGLGTQCDSVTPCFGNGFEIVKKGVQFKVQQIDAL